MSRKDLEAANVLPAKQATRVPKEKQSMEGMPGYIKTGQGKDGESIARGHSGIGPKREGPIGHKGRARNEEHIYRDGAGTMTKNYKSDSTGKPGHYHMSGEGQPASEAHKGTAPIGSRHGHPGRMEHMSGRARTSAEGRKKSRMY
jgi:hypothetical protein